MFFWGVAWVYLALSPVYSGLGLWRLFIPSIGFVLALGAALAHERRRIAQPVAAVLLVAYAWGSLSDGRVWARASRVMRTWRSSELSRPSRAPIRP